MGAFGMDELHLMLQREFAPWIQALNIEPLDITEHGMTFVLPKSTDLVRSGDVLCGQAIASVADTISVLTLFSRNDPPRPLTTVDMNVQFLRPLFLGDVLAETFIQSTANAWRRCGRNFARKTAGALANSPPAQDAHSPIFRSFPSCQQTVFCVHQRSAWSNI